MEIKELGIMAFLAIGALAFLFMPTKAAEQNFLETNKVAGSSGGNSKYQIEADGSVLAAAVGIKGPSHTPAPKPAPAPTPPKPRKPILPWRGEEGPDGHPEQPEAARIDVEALLKPVQPVPAAPKATSQGGCANGQCYQPARWGFRWR